MSSSNGFGVRSAAAILVIATAAACADDHPIGLSSDSLTAQARLSMSALSADSLDENPISLAIAAEIPSFGGLHFDDQGRLVIALTDISRLSDAEFQVRARLGIHGTTSGEVDRVNVRFVGRSVQYPFLELARYRTVLRDHIFSIPAVVSLDVKESANRVSVGVDDAAAERQVRSLVSTLDIPQTAVSVFQIPRPVASSNTLLHSMGHIHGGWEIYNSNFVPCTLGFSARRAVDGSPVFVTNSHCTTIEHSYDGGPFSQYGIHIGNEILDPEPHTCGAFISDPCRNADAALISAVVPIQLGRIARTTESSGCEDCSMSLTIDHANPTLQITAENGYIIENEVLHKIGKTTGWTYGAVEDACADYEFDGWVRQCSDRVDYSRGPGDSGSPVFSLRSDGTVALRGIHFGYVIPPYGDALMSNIHRVEMDLGGLTVFDSGTPNVSIFGPTEVPSGTYCRWDASVTGGIPPYSYEWFGLLSGSNPTVEGFVTSSDGLSVTVTDHLGRSRTASISVTVVEGNGGIIC